MVCARRYLFGRMLPVLSPNDRLQRRAMPRMQVRQLGAKKAHDLRPTDLTLLIRCAQAEEAVQNITVPGDLCEAHTGCERRPTKRPR
jgi:hypothetical protein